MTKFVVTYQRKVQVRPYEMLEIGIVQDFETSLTGHDEAFTYLKNTITEWIEREQRRLGAKR